MPDPGPRQRTGIHAYDDLEPELRRHVDADPGDRGYHDRRERLIREFLPLVRNLARRYSGPHSAEDIEQVGTVGLIKAIDRYDPDSATGGALAYLVPSVRGEMLRHLRDHTWSLRVPRGLKDMSVSVNRATIALTQRLGRSPRPSELAEELGVDVSDVVETLGALESYRTESLDMPDQESGQPLAERVGDHDPALDLVEHQGDLRRVIDELPERERTILLLRFYGEYTQIQIAERIGVSQMHVSRLLSRTLERLRTRLSAEEA
ncbi:SigB/SigF/SigG family RNA polymerase sigma factor [Pseudonocardia endophytica]|uniref:RNA polymerase sigma-37 (RpsB/SigB) subunit n=1 Tax=Pseudonocardia endophytica TaxID=401976 RepID=A0A4R1HR78_PSEEN|nr:SigB/SigF/SigG family RNA polymerase sigma factor [Pseudonocardia endophytica]TCK24648.1 RNA polymerase sigma-37 (RpsB/SigB) subunit [Pseudonocardia endophytica]